jgi:hypothetical protein
MRRIETEIDIEAPPSRVWLVLTDFDAYPDWNPFITRVKGSAIAGARLEVTMAQPHSQPMTFRPRVLAAVAETELRWIGHVIIPGFFDGEHRFLIEKRSEGSSVFRQSERFTGILLPLFPSLLRAAAAGFVAMNGALKQRAEQKQ